MDDYTQEPIVAIRIFDEGDGWAMDGVDGKGGYTEQVWSYDTEAECDENRAAFIRHLIREGHTVTLPE